MAKKSENNKENNSGNMVLVDGKLLGQGLKTAFTGIAMVFDSLGASEASSEIKAAQKAQPAVDSSASVVNTENPDTTEKEDTEELPFAPEPVEAAKPGKSEESMKSAEQDKPAEPEKLETPSPTTPSITIDDITKVIVAKIKKKRDNNAKIGSLLKTYGVDKVSGLPPEKYEAFLTDISEL